MLAINGWHGSFSFWPSPKQAGRPSQGVQALTTLNKPQPVKSMKLPLSTGDKEEIAAAYEKARLAMKKSAEALDELAKTLEIRIACVDKRCGQSIMESFDAVGSAIFSVKMANHKARASGLSGREFTKPISSSDRHPYMADTMEASAT